MADESSRPGVPRRARDHPGQVALVAATGVDQGAGLQRREVPGAGASGADQVGVELQAEHARPGRRPSGRLKRTDERHARPRRP